MTELICDGITVRTEGTPAALMFHKR